MNSNKIRQNFLNFFKQRGHAVVPSSSLIPDDPSVLLTTAGMQQFKSYYTGDADPLKDFGSKNTASIQKSFRTSDIDEVGDETHLTFFEMLGNFSFGGYFKKEAIAYAFDFITRELGLAISYVTVFRGSDAVPRDEESRAVWNSLGVTDVREQGMEEVFWGPTGNSGPCGPTTEIYCRNIQGQDVEIWNLVFNEYFFPGSRPELDAGTPNKKLEPLKTPGVDTGMGMERLAMIVQEDRTIFDTDLLSILLAELPEGLDLRIKRIIADHVRGIAFLLADRLEPSNKAAGYILRRLMRRVMVYEKIHSIPPDTVEKIITAVVANYGGFYPELEENRDVVLSGFAHERGKFGAALERGMRELKKLNDISAKSAFQLYESYGLPFEIIREVGGAKARTLAREEFDQEFARHQENSRAGAERKFGGHGLALDTGELKAASDEEIKKVTRLHTATHLLNAALHLVLGDSIEQRGSDITPERTRFDFKFHRKLEPEELKRIETLVNEAADKNLPVTRTEIDLEEAKKSGALYFTQGKYPSRVSVYTIGSEKEIFSRELCGGPHVSRTGEIGEFKILKEESSSAGVRRIRATIE